jgi:hypothetical protein
VRDYPIGLQCRPSTQSVRDEGSERKAGVGPDWRKGGKLLDRGVREFGP